MKRENVSLSQLQDDLLEIKHLIEKTNYEMESAFRNIFAKTDHPLCEEAILLKQYLPKSLKQLSQEEIRIQDREISMMYIY